jgi:hypothetical protein
VSLPGPMAESMRVTIWMTKKKDKEYSTGQTAESMTVAGRMENSMASVIILLLAANQSRENGKKAKDCIGCKMMGNERYLFLSGKLFYYNIPK